MDPMDFNEMMLIIHEIFDASLPRLGPGDDESTKKALNELLSVEAQCTDKPNSGKLRILDIGCGNGAPTIQIAKLVDGTILAVDNYQPYLDELQRRADAEGVSEKIQPYLKDMSSLDLEKGSFDLIWSEGALGMMGFGKGLEVCHSLLKDGGLMAVTELTWFRQDVPAECREFFAKTYPGIVDNDTNLANIKSCGYEVVGHFTLPESSWWESYYNPVKDRLPLLQKKYATDSKWAEMIDSVKMEMELYSKYPDYYGYVFYLMRRC